jgi:phosphate transport system permease protein
MEKPNTPAGSRDLAVQKQESVRSYFKSGQPWVWLTAAAISVCFIITVALLCLTAARGMPHFWPAKLIQAEYQRPGEPMVPLLAEMISSEEVTAARLQSAGYPIAGDKKFFDRVLFKVGNRDVYDADFKYLLDDWIKQRSWPQDAVVLERMEWGNFHGFVDAIKTDGAVVASGDKVWELYPELQNRVNELRSRISKIEKKDIGGVNYKLERMRLDAKRLQLAGKTPENDAADFKDFDERRKLLEAEYQKSRSELDALNKDMARDVLVAHTVEGKQSEIPLSKLLRAYRPNQMSVFAKTGLYFVQLWEFVSDDPREANTEGGIFPAIFGTVMMVILMSIFVTPFGILAALYLREYAKQGPITQVIRIAVNNLAGVPSIVYGMFGLGFFVYFLGGSLDKLFYPESLPSPTFGTPGILWASLTLAILTLPVVIVATEEGLARIPRSIREASLALGATKAETLWRVVLPMASPAMMTGLILAIARAAGEVAPLMLVGVVKLAPSLPLDGNFPFVHLERKFMHLGFHIYDVGFQSPNVEAARPLVYATSFLLVLVIIGLNLTAIRIRNQLRERYKALEH